MATLVHRTYSEMYCFCIISWMKSVQCLTEVLCVVFVSKNVDIIFQSLKKVLLDYCMEFMEEVWRTEFLPFLMLFKQFLL